MALPTIESFRGILESDKPIDALAPGLLLRKEGAISAYYGPFEHVNPDARVALVGITPGRTQWINACLAARKALKRGESAEAALETVKQEASFSGAMRKNLVDMLDHIGINKALRIATCGELFGRAGHLVQKASLLRNPVFVDGDDYRGTPPPLRSPLLSEQLRAGFVADTRKLRNPIYIPLGPVVAETLRVLKSAGEIEGLILTAMPHPSGANAERIAYFLGRKRRSDLSEKTNADKLDAALAELRRQVAAL